MVPRGKRKGPSTISLWRVNPLDYSFFVRGGSDPWCFGTTWELTVFRQSERYRIKLVYQARPAVALPHLVNPMRLPRSPPYLSDDHQYCLITHWLLFS